MIDLTSVVLGAITLVGGCGWVVNHHKYKQEVKHLEAENRPKMSFFKIDEFECKCCGGLPGEVRRNIEALVEEVLDPARVRLGIPIYVNSGYRCARHNEAVLGNSRSQHLKGEAADLRIDGKPEELAKVIVELGKFDQMIIYPSFVHVSWKKNGPNRHQILKKK